MTNIWIVAEDEKGLATCLAEIGECKPTGIVAIGGDELARAASRIGCTVKWIDKGNVPSETYSESIAELLVASGADVMIGIAQPAVRAAFAKTQGRIGAVLVSNVVSISCDEGAKQVTRGVYDEYTEVDTVRGAVLCLVNPVNIGTQCVQGEADNKRVERVDVEPDAFIDVLETGSIPSSSIEKAERVIGVGSGIRSAEVFSQVEELARVLGAEIGPSMNFAEHTNYMPNQRYIGLSGVRIAPQLYLAIGISGAPQHRVGVRNADTVVVVNKDPKAKFFSHADYGIVGTAEEVVPALIESLL